LPEELSNYRNPNSKPEAKANAQVLIAFLRKRLEAGLSAKRPVAEDITVGDWLRKFTRIETSPRTGINISENGSCSEDTLTTYESYFKCHLEGDPILNLKMAELEKQDVDLSTRMSVKEMAERKDKDGKIRVPGWEMGGTRTFVGVIKFVRMAFKNYEAANECWLNPYRNVKEPKYESIDKGRIHGRGNTEILFSGRSLDYYGGGGLRGHILGGAAPCRGVCLEARRPGLA
jgi:hypothetical protein